MDIRIKHNHLALKGTLADDIDSTGASLDFSLEVAKIGMERLQQLLGEGRDEKQSDHDRGDEGEGFGERQRLIEFALGPQ